MMVLKFLLKVIIQQQKLILALMIKIKLLLLILNAKKDFSYTKANVFHALKEAIGMKNLENVLRELLINHQELRILHLLQLQNQRPRNLKKIKLIRLVIEMS